MTIVVREKSGGDRADAEVLEAGPKSSNRPAIAPFWRRWITNCAGATGIEYGLIAALIAVAMLAALINLGGQVRATYEYIQAQYQAAT